MGGVTRRKDIDNETLITLNQVGVSCAMLAKLYKCSPGLVQKRIETQLKPAYVKQRQRKYDDIR